ncbi:MULTISPECIES: VanZ family protein [unclassified Undibacterium]|uniref:VanZ family protein n=1 Tax=unclassified Undibacterium TaxID=2630295 RepID=UPI002AC9CAF3|nr:MULTISPECIES: VanZ family protein [unclassified Undibacterium]MEB0137479.1 VanZ family protein [Undibacterium sp. CCC2.1]MEB0170856.1 VanZ family protein [Undibacterium sp. CCC1.1]MEB0174808.1 VanZ family protein [Undibacterium sp. CCC3.4]MEB0214144.1 VanZ family protein [Undibacterium sp. 5I2]WPX44457.1 VanZ family protein [Undibacterium sp. CCC3.4]
MSEPDTPPMTPLRHSSPFARASLLAYLILILYASWYPFTGWQANNLSALPAVIRQWPRYWTLFDAGINVVGYIPFGMLIVFALYPRRVGWQAVLLGAVGAVVVSASAELVQYFLPSRVTSLLDFLTNASGGLLGALSAALLTPLVLEKGRLQLLRKQWTYREASWEVVLLGLWPMAQLYPQAYLFGLGQIFPILSQHLSDIFEFDIDLGSLILHGWEFNADAYLLAETFITACGCSGAILLSLSLLTPRAPKLRISALLLLFALTGKSLASALLLNPDYAFAWLTPGARGGLLISLIMLYGFSFAPLHVQRRLAFLLLSISLVVLNLVPDNPYFAATMQTWIQGKFLNFNGAAQFLSLSWPFLALWILLLKPKAADIKVAVS